MIDRSEIEAQIAAAPHDDSLFLVYADWLQQHGDPRGELIALEAAARAAPGRERVQWRKRRGELFARHPELMPPRQRLDLEWHLGFVRRVDFYQGSDVRAVLQHPALAFVRVVVFRDEHPPDAETIALLPRPSLHTVALGDADRPRWGYEFGGSRTPVDVDPLLAALPMLEHLYVRHPIQLTAGGVSSLDLGVASHTLAMIRRARLPRLERLVLQLSLGDWRVPNASQDLDDLREMFAAPPATLTALELRDADGDAVIAALIDSPLLPRLRRLRLENPNLSIEGVRRLTRDAFGHVALELADPLLDEACVARLAEEFPDVETISPRMRQLLRRG